MSLGGKLDQKKKSKRQENKVSLEHCCQNVLTPGTEQQPRQLLQHCREPRDSRGTHKQPWGYRNLSLPPMCTIQPEAGSPLGEEETNLCTQIKSKYAKRYKLKLEMQKDKSMCPYPLQMKSF